MKASELKVEFIYSSLKLVDSTAEETMEVKTNDELDSPMMGDSTGNSAELKPTAPKSSAATEKKIKGRIDSCEFVTVETDHEIKSDDRSNDNSSDETCSDIKNLPDSKISEDSTSFSEHIKIETDPEEIKI